MVFRRFYHNHSFNKHQVHFLSCFLSSSNIFSFLVFSVALYIASHICIVFPTFRFLSFADIFVNHALVVVLSNPCTEYFLCTDFGTLFFSIYYFCILINNLVFFFYFVFHFYDKIFNVSTYF